MRKLTKEEILSFTSRVIRRSETPLGEGAIYDAVNFLAQERQITLKQVRKALEKLMATREVAVTWEIFNAKYLWIADPA